MLVLEKLENRENFTEIDTRIADHILRTGEGLKEESVRQISELLYVAPSTVIRFAQKLGYQGFEALKADYLKEITYLSSHFKEVNPNYPFAAGDTETVIIGKLLSLHEEILKDCRSLLTSEILASATKILMDAEVIYLFGTATQMGTAQSFVEKMGKIGREAYAIPQRDEIFWRSFGVKRKCCFILVSYTGETTTVIELARQLKRQNIPAIALTSYGNNTLSSLCTCCMYVSTREHLRDNIGPFGTPVSMQFLLDTLYSSFFVKHYEKNLKQKLEYNRLHDGRHSDNPILGK